MKFSRLEDYTLHEQRAFLGVEESNGKLPQLQERNLMRIRA